jgi:hypothetical protein
VCALQRLKEEQAAAKELYAMEVQVRAKQERVMGEMIALVRQRVGGPRGNELIEELKELQRTCAISVHEEGGSFMGSLDEAGRRPLEDDRRQSKGLFALGKSAFSALIGNDM